MAPPARGGDVTPDAPQKPHLCLFALGGTIASVRADGQKGAAPRLTGADLLALMPGLARRATVASVEFLQVPSVEIDLRDVLRLRDAVDRALAAGACGVVVTQGTDTLEETAFAFDLAYDGSAPVVFTGAMRNPSELGPDGPANLAAALNVALSPRAEGAGALVVFNDEIHGARFVRKMHGSSPASFRSPGFGPIGQVTEGRVIFSAMPGRTPRLAPSPSGPIPPVALIKMSIGDDGRLLPALPELGYRGLVVEAFGGGHVRAEVAERLRALVEVMPVVLASRTGAGTVLASTYHFPGSEIDLLGMGLVRAGMLDGLKARILLSFCLARGIGRPGIAEAFASLEG